MSDIPKGWIIVGYDHGQRKPILAPQAVVDRLSARPKGALHGR